MNDSDILAIDGKIQLSLENEYKNLPEHKNRLAELERTYLSGNLSTRAKSELQNTIAELKETIEKIERRETLNFYLIDTAELVEKYKEILKTPIKVSFCGKTTQDNKEKNEIIQRYLEAAQKYFPVELPVTEKKFKITCENCSNKKDFITEENAYICLECFAQQEILQHKTSYKDSDRVNISAKYTYDRKVHFRDCINQYQGKQNCTIDPIIYEKLEDAFERHHLLFGDKTTKREIRYQKITREHVMMFLKELGFSKQYENVILIHYNLTGKKPDDISHLEDKLLADFDVLVETYDKHFKNKVDRVNFLSSQYILYQLLQRHKHACRKEDFIMLKTVDRKIFHDTICREIFDILGWNFYPSY